MKFQQADSIQSCPVVTKCHLYQDKNSYFVAMEIKRVILTIETIETTTITISEQGVTPDEKSFRFVFVAVQHTKTGGLPDMFPSLAVGDRTIENGARATAVSEIAADASGTFIATGLVEVASMQNSSPDPNAQVDLTVTWTCQEP